MQWLSFLFADSGHIISAKSVVRTKWRLPSTQTFRPWNSVKNMSLNVYLCDVQITYRGRCFVLKHVLTSQSVCIVPASICCLATLYLNPDHSWAPEKTFYPDLVTNCGLAQTKNIVYVYTIRAKRLYTAGYFSTKLRCQHVTPQIAKLMRPTWGPPGSCRALVGPMLASWTLLSVIAPMWGPSCYNFYSKLPGRLHGS